MRWYTDQANASMPPAFNCRDVALLNVVQSFYLHRGFAIHFLGIQILTHDPQIKFLIQISKHLLAHTRMTSLTRHVLPSGWCHCHALRAFVPWLSLGHRDTRGHPDLVSVIEVLLGLHCELVWWHRGGAALEVVWVKNFNIFQLNFKHQSLKLFGCFFQHASTCFKEVHGPSQWTASTWSIF